MAEPTSSATPHHAVAQTTDYSLLTSDYWLLTTRLRRRRHPGGRAGEREAWPCRIGQRGLLQRSGEQLALFGALRAAASAQLRADEDLRARVEALAADLSATPSEQAPPLELPPADPAAVRPPAEVALPSGLELLERVRNALEDSAALLQAQGDDQSRQLARELNALQAALPDTTGPRLPFARPAAGVTAAT